MNKRTIVVGAVAAVGVVTALGFFWPFSRNSKVLRVPGTVEIQEIRLGSKVGGRVADVFVREGDEVEAGRELLRFDAPELATQKAQLEQKLKAARLELKKAKDGPRPQERTEAEAAFRAAKARWDKIEEGWRKEERAQATHDLEAAKVDLEFARKAMERIQKANYTVAENEYDAARNRLSTAQEKFNSAQARSDMMKEGSREQDKREAKADHDRLKARHELMQEGTRGEDIELAEAQAKEIEAKLREIDVYLNETVVRAPSKLRIEVLAVRKGDIVAPNQPVVRALQAEDRWVKAFVPSTELGKLRRGDTVEVTCDSYPDRKFTGTVVQISNISEFTPRNVQSIDERRHQVFGIKVRVEDGGEVFKAGMAAEVLLPAREAP